MAIIAESVAVTGCPYIPWIGFFYKLSLCEKYVALDTVQMSRGRNFAYRNAIRLNDEAHWLSIPIRRVNKGKMPLGTVVIDNSKNWRRKHLMALKHAYSKSPWFDEVMALLEPAYSEPYELLCDLNLDIIARLSGYLGFERTTLMASSLGVETEDATERLAELTAKAGGSVYISGFSGPDYMSHDPFAENGVKCCVYDFRHPVYGQSGSDFIPKLSILDLLFSQGSDSAGIVEACGSGVKEFVHEDDH